jgi:hypothetical protein
VVVGDINGGGERPCDRHYARSDPGCSDFLVLAMEEYDAALGVDAHGYVLCTNEMAGILEQPALLGLGATDEHAPLEDRARTQSVGVPARSRAGRTGGQ